MVKPNDAIEDAGTFGNINVGLLKLACHSNKERFLKDSVYLQDEMHRSML
jgi:hypothetical protein